MRSTRMGGGAAAPEHLAAHARLVKSASPDVLHATTVMRAYIRACLPLQSLLLLRGRPASSPTPPHSPSRSRPARLPPRVRSQVRLRRRRPLRPLRTAPVEMYAKRGRVDLATAAFDEGERPDATCSSATSCSRCASRAARSRSRGRCSTECG
ncbi:hypothetical protein ABZP36_002187 [Zizania latifolia]